MLGTALCIVLSAMLAGCVNKPDEIVGQLNWLQDDYVERYEEYFERWVAANDPEAEILEKETRTAVTKSDTRTVSDEFHGKLKRGDVIYNYVFVASSDKVFVDEKSEEMKEFVQNWVVSRFLTGSRESFRVSPTDSFSWRFEKEYNTWKEKEGELTILETYKGNSWMKNMYPYEVAKGMEENDTSILNAEDIRIGGFEVDVTDEVLLDKLNLILDKTPAKAGSKALDLFWLYENRDMFTSDLVLYNKDRRWRWTITFETKTFKDEGFEQCVSITKDRLPDFWDEETGRQYILQEKQYYILSGSKKLVAAELAEK